MLASELIKQLQAKIKTHGDLPVCLQEDDRGDGAPALWHITMVSIAENEIVGEDTEESTVIYIF